MSTLTTSRSLADMRAVQADNLDRIRDSLTTLNPKDIVPILVARSVLKSHEMGVVYSEVTIPLYEESRVKQVDALIAILKTKNHWVGPLTDALIRNGQAPVAKQLILMQHPI